MLYILKTVRNDNDKIVFVKQKDTESNKNLYCLQDSKGNILWKPSVWLKEHQSEIVNLGIDKNGVLYPLKNNQKINFDIQNNIEKNPVKTSKTKYSVTINKTDGKVIVSNAVIDDIFIVDNNGNITKLFPVNIANMPFSAKISLSYPFDKIVLEDRRIFDNNYNTNTDIQKALNNNGVCMAVMESAWGKHYYLYFSENSFDLERPKFKLGVSSKWAWVMNEGNITGVVTYNSKLHPDLKLVFRPLSGDSILNAIDNFREKILSWLTTAKLSYGIDMLEEFLIFFNNSVERINREFIAMSKELADMTLDEFTERYKRAKLSYKDADGGLNKLYIARTGEKYDKWEKQFNMLYKKSNELSNKRGLEYDKNMHSC